jgi:hypothetical protein
MTDAHDVNMEFHILAHIPEHDPRETDPNYKYFLAAKRRIKKAGLWKCVINDDLCGGQVELHHTHIEFSQIPNADKAKVEAYFGLNFKNDDEFSQWLESPGNLEVLCTNHHRTHYGVHTLPHALWESLRFRKVGTLPAAEVVTKSDMKKRKINDIIKSDNIPQEDKNNGN